MVMAEFWFELLEARVLQNRVSRTTAVVDWPLVAGEHIEDCRALLLQQDWLLLRDLEVAA